MSCSLFHKKCVLWVRVWGEEFSAEIVQGKQWPKTYVLLTATYFSQIGAIQGCMVAARHMRRDEGGSGGRIINMASSAGTVCYQYNTDF